MVAVLQYTEAISVI